MMSHTGSLPDYKSRKWEQGSRYFSDANSRNSPYNATREKHYMDRTETDSQRGSKKLKDPKTKGDVFQRFVDTTSLQGIPSIHAAGRWYVKAFWSLLFIAATVMWIVHSTVLIKKYIEYDTNSQVKITYTPVPYPTITLCNINPIREKAVEQYGNAVLKRVINLLRPDDSSKKRKKRQVDSSSSEDYDYSYIDSSREGDFYEFNVTFDNYDDIGFISDLIEDGYSEEFIIKTLVREAAAQSPDFNRTMMGHRLSDMMLGCTLDGRQCTSRNFSRYLDYAYGNCFSFNSAELLSAPIESFDSGTLYGLSLKLYVENKEYIKGIQQGRGVRLLLHQFGTQPFVEQSGISIPTGFQTYVGMRQITQTRLGGKYGTCGDGGRYESYYQGQENYTYTLDGCYETCEVRTISEECGCFYAADKHLYRKNDLRNLRPCRPADESCFRNVDERFENQNLDCDCEQACSTTSYDVSLSYDQWPDDTLWSSLVRALCQSLSERECQEIADIPVEDRDSFLQKNFIHLKIYFQDLNVETIKEVPDYEDIQFYSDIGGAIGLWLGASIITVFELFALGCNCIHFCAKKDTYRQRKQVLQKQYGVNKLSELQNSSNNSPAIVRRARPSDVVSSYSSRGFPNGTRY